METRCFMNALMRQGKRFSDFEYDGVVYRRIECKQDLDVMQQDNMCIASVELFVLAVKKEEGYSDTGEFDRMMW